MSITRIESGARMSQAVVANGFVFLAGQVAPKPVADVQAQTQQVLAEIDRLLAAVGSSKQRILTANVYLSDIGTFSQMNAAWDAWVAADAKDGGGDKLIYLLAHKSRDAAKASWKAFSADPEWKEVAKRTTANGQIVAKAESLFLEAADFARPMDAGNGKGAARVFELRTYTAAEGKLAALDARFRDHTIGIFARHGTTNLGYFHPTDADKGAGRTLVYLLAYPSREAAAASWKAFREDAEWVKVRTASEQGGKLTTKVESVYLAPTDFSRIR